MQNPSLTSNYSIGDIYLTDVDIKDVLLLCQS